MTEGSYDVIVIGGGYAGATAANRLPRSARVLLIDPKDDFVHRVRLHEVAAGGHPRVAIPFRKMLKGHVEHRPVGAARIEPGSVELSDGSKVRGRHILVTTGSDVSKPGAISSLDAAAAIAERVGRAAPGTHVSVRGAGLTGIECAAEIAYRRPDLVVHLHGRGAVGAQLPDNARDYLRRTLTRLGVLLDRDSQDPGTLEIDATGLQVAAVAGDSGQAVDARGRMHVNPTLQAAPGVWGAGDAVAVEGQPHLRASCATAIPMGAHAADNIARALSGERPTAFSFGYSYRCISLGRRAGLIVPVNQTDEPTGRLVTGVPGAVFKAAVCAAVVQVSSSFARRYSWRAAD